MNPVLRVILVALFVGGTIGALAIPIINASDEVIEPADEPSPEPSPTPEETETPEPEPSETPEPTPSPTPEGPVTIVGDLPSRCLGRAAAPAGGGHIAFADEAGVVIATIGAGTAGRITGAQSPIDWSPSGGFLVTGDGGLFDVDGQALPGAPGSGLSMWSPVADCLFSLDGRRLEVTGPPARSFLYAEVRNGSQARDPFMSGNGRRIGWSMKGGPMGIALASGATYEPDVDEGGPHCAGVPMGLAQGQIFIGTDFIGAEGFTHTSASCSPDGSLVIATREPAGGGRGDLVLYRRSGAFVQDMTTDAGFSDEYGVWGRGGTGVLFVRLPNGGGQPQLWFIPEGGSARDTGLRPRAIQATEGWDEVVTWSAAPPDGRADRRGG